MRVAVLSPPWFAVPPPRYGGIESVVALLADGLVEDGHDVTLFASGDSQTRARLVSVFDEGQSPRIGTLMPELRQAISCLARGQEFDVISDHTSPFALALAGVGAVPLLHTVHGPLAGELGEAYAEVCAATPRAALVSISMNQREPRPRLPWAANCPNGLDLAEYPFAPHRGEELVFVGRMCADKGPHRAIAIARQAGLPLRLAGKCQEPAERAYFEAHVRPALGGGIEYVGEVRHEDKVALLQGARAVLFPIEWDEPFGLVMIEAMACGAPVIATRRGAVPEVIDDGRTGILVDDWREMAGVLEAAARIDPHEQRRTVEERFSQQRMVGDYVRAFEATIAGWHHGNGHGGNGTASSLPDAAAVPS